MITNFYILINLVLVINSITKLIFAALPQCCLSCSFFMNIRTLLDSPETEKKPCLRNYCSHFIEKDLILVVYDHLSCSALFDTIAIIKALTQSCKCRSFDNPSECFFWLTNPYLYLYKDKKIMFHTATDKLM